MVTVGNGERGGLGPVWSRWGGIPCVAAIGIVGLVLSPLLIGIEPVGGDPDLMYRPIKTALAESLGRGTLPYWSDLFGIGVPLVAESHAAAFYPPNWLAYRLFDVPLAYRLLMWVHFVACAVATYVYARVLGLGGWGSALAAVAFTLGGFQAAHACHEPFYTLLPYLPLALLLAERYLATGRLAWLAGLALCWGIQITLGHFQIQMWTGGLVALTGLAWLKRNRRCWRRVAALLGGLAWGLTVAAVQLLFTLELTRISGFGRPENALMNYACPTRHLAQWALPSLFLSRNLDLLLEREHPYWSRYGATPEESCAYLGVTAFLLACVGVASAWKSRRKPGDASERGSESTSSVLSPSMTMWLWVALAGMVLATMPLWWRSGFQLILKIPGFALFRAPGRYALLSSLGLALWAGRGVDRSIAPRRFRAGLVLAFSLLIAALVVAFGLTWADSGFRAMLGPGTIGWRYAAALLAWVLAVGGVLAWRRGWLGAWGPLGLVAIELAGLFYLGATPWGWSVAVPGSSPIFARLKQERDVGLVGGQIQNLAARAGFMISYPNVGITAPPPTYMLEASIIIPPDESPIGTVRWHRRFGVTHGVWESIGSANGADIIYDGEDPVLTKLLNLGNVPQDRQRWKLIRYPEPFPVARVVPRAVEVRDWAEGFASLTHKDHEDDALFLPEDRPRDAKPDPTRDPRGPMYNLGRALQSDIELGPRATTTRIVDWDGRSGTIEHDGSCVLVLRRLYYPGWTVRVNDGPERPVSRVNVGFQGVVLTGKGPSRIVMSYRPTWLRFGSTLSLMGILVALGTIAYSAFETRRRSASVL